MASERRCCIPKCGKTRKDDVILHSFPNPAQEMDRYLAWSQAVGKSETMRAPLIDITNIPSTSMGSEIANPPLLDINIPSTSLGAASIPVVEKAGGKVIAMKKEKNILLKKVKKLQIKKNTYAVRLKKALKLSENITFKNTLQKFTNLAAIFTLMQFREVGKMGHRFTGPEKIMALSLYKRSPRTYRWLQKFFVLPSEMTLNRLISQANLKPGINKNIFNQLPARVDKMSSDEKL